MKYFYDTEFNEDGKTIDLISIGIVAEDGREFYAVSAEFDTRRVAKDWWLMQNVMSSIGHETFVVCDFQGAPIIRDFRLTTPYAMTRLQMRDEILKFLGDDADPEWWAWYSSYDHVALIQLLAGKMIDQPKGWPYTTMDISQLHKFLKCPEMPQQPSGKHNALEDAKFNVVRYNYLMDLKDQK